MAARTLVLASASPARLRLLHNSGIKPLVIPSHIPEDDVEPGDPEAMVSTLARRKAEAVALGRHGELVLGCDSVLDMGGVALGKPASAEEAAQRWRRQRGRAGTLVTGHHLIDTATGRAVADVARTTVRFGTPTDAEILAYVGTGEPLGVAGAFTLDGRSAAFIDGVDGDPSNVIGLSLPLLRRLLADLAVTWTSLWA
jgi:septum formation protein